MEEYPSHTPARARADVYIDNQHVGNVILTPSEGPSCFRGSWLDKNSLKPFIFTVAKKQGQGLSDTWTSYRS